MTPAPWRVPSESLLPFLFESPKRIVGRTETNYAAEVPAKMASIRALRKA